MPSPFRKKKNKPAASGSDRANTPLAARERELAEQQHRLQAEIAELQRTVEEAPRRRAEQARREREEMLERARQSSYESRRSGALPDKRFTGGMGGRIGGAKEGGGTRRARSIGGRRAVPVLRHERRAAMLKTLAMLALLVVIVCYLIYNYFL